MQMARIDLSDREQRMRRMEEILIILERLKTHDGKWMLLPHLGEIMEIYSAAEEDRNG